MLRSKCIMLQAISGLGPPGGNWRMRFTSMLATKREGRLGIVELCSKIQANVEKGISRTFPIKCNPVTLSAIARPFSWHRA